MSTNPLTQEELLRILDYNPEAGDFTWKVSRSNRVKVGQKTGYLMKCGYLLVNINYRPEYAHRLAWLYTYGRWPCEMVDHKNGNRSDNRLSNLREATARQNAGNSRTRKTRKTPGSRGVSLRNGQWVARIGPEGKHLGRFSTEQEAATAFATAAKEYYGAFALAEYGHEKTPTAHTD